MSARRPTARSDVPFLTVSVGRSVESCSPSVGPSGAGAVNRGAVATGVGLGVGGFALMPANVNHFAYTKTETTILLYGVGPVDFKYVNPADDPRMKTSQRAKQIELGLGIRDDGQEM